VRVYRLLECESSPVNFSMDENQEMQRQNNRLFDTVAEMKKELKEFKGEF